MRTYDDPATWTEPGSRNLARRGPLRDAHRHVPLADEWELYDLDADPTESVNRWDDAAFENVRAALRATLERERARCNPPRNQPWPYSPLRARPARPAEIARYWMGRVRRRVAG